MNEEEKKAVEDSKDLIKVFNNYKDKDFIDRLYYKNKPIEENLKILLNLIEKLQKENEELKSKNKTLEELLQGNLYELYKYYKELAGTYQGNCISVQKVKDKIEELQNGPLKINENNKYYYETEAYNKIIIQVLQGLLEGRK